MNRIPHNWIGFMVKGYVGNGGGKIRLFFDDLGAAFQCYKAAPYEYFDLLYVQLWSIRHERDTCIAAWR